MGISPKNNEENTVTKLLLYPDRKSFQRTPEKIHMIIADHGFACSDINFVIMDYLINEGYPAAAKKFAAEAGLPQPVGDHEHIEERVDIRNAILAGNIEPALEKINELNPSVSARTRFSPSRYD